MDKLYYTDPLKAAWMVREFEVKIWVPEHRYKILKGCFPNGVFFNESSLAYEIVEEEKMNGRHPKYYIHPDSLAVFEPKEGDLIERETDTEHYAVWYDNIKPNDLRDSDKIIQRDGKAFFTPEVEE